MIASGKRQIYKLPDFKDFDGIIIELNNTTDRKLLDRIIAEINVSEFQRLPSTVNLRDFIQSALITIILS